LLSVVNLTCEWENGASHSTTTVVTAITIPVCAANRLVNKLTSASLLCHWLGDSLPLLFVRWHGEGRQQASIIFREAAAGTQHVSGTPYGLRLYGRRTSVLGAKSRKP